MCWKLVQSIAEDGVLKPTNVLIKIRVESPPTIFCTSFFNLFKKSHFKQDANPVA